MYKYELYRECMYIETKTRSCKYSLPTHVSLVRVRCGGFLIRVVMVSILSVWTLKHTMIPVTSPRCGYSHRVTNLHVHQILRHKTHNWHNGLFWSVVKKYSHCYWGPPTTTVYLNNISFQISRKLEFLKRCSNSALSVCVFWLTECWEDLIYFVKSSLHHFV